MLHCSLDSALAGMNGTQLMEGTVVERSHELEGSWIIVDKVTGKPVIELFDKRNVARINVDKYTVYTAHEWLASINGKQQTANS